MSYKFTKEEFENLSQDPIANEFYYTNKGKCYLFSNEKTEKIMESIENDVQNLKNDLEENNQKSELNNMISSEINHGIKFSQVSSGKNIIIHGGGTIATLGNTNQEDYVLVGGIIPKGVVLIEFICPISCTGLLFGMASLNETKDLVNLRKNFRSFRTTSRRRVAMEINYEQKTVKFFLEGIIKDKIFTIKDKFSFPCIIIGSKSISVILNPFARLSNVNFPLYLAPDSIYSSSTKSIFSRLLFLTNVPKIKLESKLNFIKTHFKIENLKEENIFIPTTSEDEIKGIIILKFDNKADLTSFKDNNKSLSINNNQIKILEKNYLNDLTEKNVFKILDLVHMTHKEYIQCDLAIKKLNSLDCLKNLYSEEDILIVEFIIEKYNEINFFQHTITQMVEEINQTKNKISSSEFYSIREDLNKANKENINFKLEYLASSDKFFLIDGEALKIFSRNSQGFFDFEFYQKDSKSINDEEKYIGFEKKIDKKNQFINILIERLELNYLLQNVSWNKIFEEIIDFEILKCLNNFINGLKNIKSINNTFLCFPLKKKYSRKFIEILINYLNRLVFITREKNKVKSCPKSNEETELNNEINQFLPFAPEVDEPLTEENKKQYFFDEYNSLSSETILLTYRILLKISEQIEMNLPLSTETHSSICQCIRWGSAFSRLSTFISFPNFLDKISVFDLANKGFYVDHVLYNELKFYGHNFIRSLNYNKIKDHESLDNLINQEYPFNYYNISSYWPNIELAYTINAQPAKLHRDPITKEAFKVENFNKSYIAQILVTLSQNGLVNIWDYRIGLNFLGNINVKKGLKEINSFTKIKEAFWLKEDCNNNIKSLNEVLNEENSDNILNNNGSSSVKNSPEINKGKEINVNSELVNNLYIMGFPLEASKHALKQTKNNFDKALEYLLEKSQDPEFMKQFTKNNPQNILEETKIFPWNCDLCTYLNIKGLLNCEMCGTLIPDKILNEHMEIVNRRKEEEKLKNTLVNNNDRQEQIIEFKDCLIKNIHIILDKRDPMAPVLVCAILFDFILNKTIVSIYKLMINPIILRDFISYEKEFFISSVDNKKFNKLEEVLSHIVENYLTNMLSLYPIFNKDVNAITYEGNYKNFLTLIPIEHFYKDMTVNSYFDSFSYEGPDGAELVILSESVNSEITINHFKINNKSKLNNIGAKSIGFELADYNMNDHFLNEFPTELKIIKDAKYFYIVDQSKIKVFNSEMDLCHIKEFNHIGLFKKIEPTFNKELDLISLKIYDDNVKFTEILLDINSNSFDGDSNKDSISNSLNSDFKNLDAGNLQVKEIEYFTDLLDFEKVDIKLNSRDKYSIINGTNSISSKKIFVDLKNLKSQANLGQIDVEFSQKVPLVISNINFYMKSKNKPLKNINYLTEEYLTNNAQNIHNIKDMNVELENKNDLHNVIPLTVTDFKGAQFQQFVNVSSIIFGKNFTSNYHKPEFLFSHLHEKIMTVNSVVVGSELNSKTGEIPLGEALLFLLNDLDSISLAHEFTHFDLSVFSNFVKIKEQKKEEFFEWEPVAYINMGEKEYIRTKIYDSRPCKYILLLPTNARSLPKNFKKGFNSSVMSINLFAAEGIVYSNEFEKREYFNNATKSLLDSNGINDESGLKAKITIEGDYQEKIILKENHNLKINAIIPNTFCSFENTDVFISKNKIENLLCPDKLISKLTVYIDCLENVDLEMIGFTIEFQTFKKIEESVMNNFLNLRNLNIQKFRMALIDKDNFGLLNEKLCNLLVSENADFKKKHAIIKYFNYLILRIPSIAEKISIKLDLNQFIILNILQNEEELLINSSLAFLISIKLSITSKSLIKSIFDIIDSLDTLKISFLGFNSFMLLVNNIFNDSTINYNDSPDMKNLYMKIFQIINKTLINLNETNPLSNLEIFLKNHLKIDEFPSDDKAFCLNKEDISKSSDIKQFSLVSNNCFGENHNGSIKINVDLLNIHNIKSVKLNFEVNESQDNYFKLIVWGSDYKQRSFNVEDYKMLYHKNFLDDMWKQLTKYDSEMKANEKYFLTKDFRSLEISNLDYNCRYLIIEINTNQGQRALKKLTNITIIPEIIGEVKHDLPNYTYSSISELFEGFISNNTEKIETVNKKYNVKFNTDGTKYVIYANEDNFETTKKENVIQIDKNIHQSVTNLNNIIPLKNSLKTYQGQLENIVNEYSNNLELFDFNASHKLRLNVNNIKSIQKNITLNEKLVNYKNLKESQYIVINYFIKETRGLVDKSNTAFNEAFLNVFENNDKIINFLFKFIESLILNSCGEFKDESIAFLDNNIWNNLSLDISESIFREILDKYLSQENNFRSCKVLLESLSKISFDFNLVLNKLKSSFEKNYSENELSDGFYSISSLILLLILKIKNEKKKKNINYELLIESSLKIMNNLTNKVKFVKEIDDMILSHSLNLLQESYSHNSFETMNHKYDSQLVDFMIDTLYNLWDNEFIKNKLFFIINKMIDPLNVLEIIVSKNDSEIKCDLNSLLRYTVNIFVNIQNFSSKFLEKMNSDITNQTNLDIKYVQLDYILDICNKIFSIKNHLIGLKNDKEKGEETEILSFNEKIKDNNFEIVKKFLKFISNLKSRKIGYSIENNLWHHIIALMSCGDLKRLIKDNLFQGFILESFLSCDDDLKDILYPKIIKLFYSLYSSESNIPVEINDSLISIALRLVDSIELSEKILLPFLNQYLEILSCGESPFVEKKNEKFVISNEMKATLFENISKYMIKYLNYSSYTGSTSSNKIVLQHLSIGISFMNIMLDFAQEYLVNVQEISPEISLSIRNLLIFITFNQYSEFTNVPPAVMKISSICSQANKIIDICCKKKKLIEVVLTEFMSIVRKIDENLLQKIKNSEISIKKGIVTSKKIYLSLDLILNKCLYDDEITKFFAFDLQGFKFFVERVNRHKNTALFKTDSNKYKKINIKINKELLDYLTEESKTPTGLVKTEEEDVYTEDLNDLNYEEYALNGKLNLLDDPVNLNTSNINWSHKKKGVNGYIVSRDLKENTHYEDVFTFKLNHIVELKNVFIAFTYSTNPDKVSGIIPSVFLLAGENLNKMKTCIKLEKIDDHAFIEKGVYTYGFNFFASDPRKIPLNDEYIQNLFNQLSNCKAKYFKFVIRRPIITANENSFQNKTNNMVSVCINHVSILGTKIADMGRVVEFIQEEEKNVSIKIISKIFTAEFIDTLKYFSRDSSLIEKIKEIYDVYEPHIDRHANILSNILINVSKYVYELGEWLLNRLLNVDNGEIHAKLAVEITQNNTEYVDERVNKYLNFILTELNPDSPTFFSNSTDSKLINLGKFADYLCVILNNLIVSPFFQKTINLEFDIEKLVSIIKNLNKYSIISSEINKLITILLIPNRILIIKNYLDIEESINLLHYLYLDTYYFDYALILSYLISNNSGFEKIAIKKKIASFYFEQFLEQVNTGLRGRNMLSLMQIIKNLSFSNEVIEIIKQNDYDFKILSSIKNKNSEGGSILINNNSSFLENVVTFLRNSMIRRDDCHTRLAKILIEDLEVCKQKIDKIYANFILMPLLRLENTVNLCMHPIDSFFNSILSAYCNIGHLTTSIKEETLDNLDSKFIIGSSLSNKSIDYLHKLLTTHLFGENYKFNHKQFNLKFSSSDPLKSFTEGISEISNILILFYPSKPDKECNAATAFFLESKFPKISPDFEINDYPEYFVPYSEKNVLIQFEGEKFNKHYLKNYESESIGEIVVEDGFITFNFFSEHDNPIRINLTPDQQNKKEFSVKISNKLIEKNQTLEFKPLYGGYLEIFTAEKATIIKKETPNLTNISGKIIPSKYIDTNGNLDFEKLKNLKYYKKSHPLLITRNNPIYEIPANISIKHVKNLFGSGDLNFSFLQNQQILSDENDLMSLFEKLNIFDERNILDICYDINQLRGIITTSNEAQTSIQNYEPNLPVYKAFEKLDGIMKIISVLKSSILMWKNKEAITNWLKWVDDVEKFSVLPTFFSTLIRHQKCFNVIFDLLCGLYDQENFNKEICIETSNYIYEIINNTFIATESSNLRYIAIEKGIFTNILQKLETLTREKPRKYLIEDKKEEKEEKEEENKLKKEQTNKIDDKKGKKGVGYGSDHTGDNKSWDVNTYLENKKTNSDQIAAIIKLLANFFNTKEIKINDTLNRIILESVILPVLESAYRGGTLLELAKQDILYFAYLELTLKLSENKNLIPYLLNISKDYKPVQTESIYNLLGQLNEGAKIFSKCIKHGMSEEQTHEEKLALEINKTYDILSKNIKAYQINLSSDKDYNEILKLPVEKSYTLLMRELSFGYMSMKDLTGKIVHYYATSLTKDTSQTKLIRLAQEYADLSRALPCEHTNSIFVRVDKENMDLLKVLIMGSAGTPYGHGAFEFDVYFDSNYPSGPPKVTLVTTGSGSVRFNPNLYSNGKVCLSLLGTWRGNSTENWDPKISTFLQVLISIQSIIMSDLVYFNEPSCEAEMGKPEGEARNEAYSNIVKYCNMKYAMIEQIKKPSKGFEEVIFRHFYLKKHQILEEVKTWIQKSKTTVAKYSSFSYDHNPSWAQKMNTQPAFTKMMEEIFIELERELNDLPIPSDLKKKQEESEKKALFKKQNKEKLEFVSLENVDVTYENEIDFTNKEININDDQVKDRWSRYIGAMGIDAVQRQANASIFLSGAGGLGVEIAKNLVLSGCKKFVINDTKNTTYLDLSSQFFLSEEDIGYNRAEKTVKKLQQLNFYVKVLSSTNPLPKTEEQLDAFGLKDFNLVILTESDYETLISVNKYCRKRNIIFISADLFGVFGRVVNDFGEKFTVNDIDGEELKDCMIKSITNEKEGLVTVLDNTRHNFQDGDEIIISEVIGMEFKNEKNLIFIDENYKKKNKSINETKHVVKVKNPQSFYIGDTSDYTSYERNGFVKQIKSVKVLEFKEIESILHDRELSAVDQNMSISDFTKIGHTTPIHIGFQALNDFVINFKSLPGIWNYTDFSKFLEIAEKIAFDYKYTLTSKDKKLLAFLSFTAQTQFSPLAAFYGGLIAQEAVKAITCKFMPIKQMFYYDAIEVLPGFEVKDDENVLTNLEKLSQTDNFKLTNSRTDGINTIVGNDVLEKMKKMKILVVGAGAIGCELLKNFSMLEVGTFKDTKITENKDDNEVTNGIIVTDPDVIEVSNLNRQFLFREKHLRLPKSSTAAAAVMQMNKNLKKNIYAKLDKVCEDSEHIFTDKFFSSLNLVANALDNIRARRYVDSRCVSNRIPLLESGTLGPKGHVQVIVPFKTESYSSQQDPEVTTDIPQCTLKMFPEEALHCIEWARDLFGKLFTQKPKNLNRVLEEGIDNQDFKIAKQVLNLIKNKPETFNDCLRIAREKFEKFFRNNIKQLMYSYPLDKKNKDGSLFWSLPKRAPDEVIFNPKDPLHYSFIASFACLIATQFKIKIPYEFPRKEESKIEMAELSNKFDLPEFKINSLKAKEIEKQVEKEKKEEDINKIEIEDNQDNNDDKTLEKIIPEFKDLIKKNKLNKFPELSETDKKLLALNSEEFEKDNDANYHIDVIYSMSNLRCRNYRLEEMDWIKVKIKAGKIIPALATTTAAIAGLQALELVKLAKNLEIEHVRNSFLNLAIPYLQASEPGTISKNKLTDDLSVTLWDRWEFKPEKNNLESVYDNLKKTHNLCPRDCFMGKIAIYPYNAYIGDEKQEARNELMNKDLIKLLNLNSDDTYVDLMITFTINDKSEEYIKNTPVVRILFK